MTRLLAIAICCVYVARAAPQPIVRAVIQSPRPIIVGQTVRLNVTVLVPNYFLGEPEFPQLNVENAIVVPPTETPLNTNETIGKETFAGITVTYLIYPQQPGECKIPPAEVSVKYASNPPESIQAHVPLPLLTFRAVVPPEAADLDYFLPTNSLTITQKFDKPLRNLRAGDTVTRTVTITALRMRAMLIPPTKFEAPDGITVYQKQPAVDDMKTDRGEFIGGKRVDSATYLIREQGEYTLPQIQVIWWNLAAHKVQAASLPSIHFAAEANPEYRPDIAPEPEPAAAPVPSETNPGKTRLIVLLIASLLAAGIIFLAGSRLGSRLRRSWAESRRAYANSEAAAFANLKSACRKGQARDAYRFLLLWLNRFSPGERLSDFLSGLGDLRLSHEIDSLTSELYGSSRAGPWSGSQMLAALQCVRRIKHNKIHCRSVLPALNNVHEQHADCWRKTRNMFDRDYIVDARDIHEARKKRARGGRRVTRRSS